MKFTGINLYSENVWSWMPEHKKTLNLFWEIERKINQNEKLGKCPSSMY